VPRLLRAFHADAPGVKVVLSQEPAHHIRHDLDRGVVELGLTMERAPDLGWLPVQRERLVVVVPPTHRLRRRTRVDLAELADDELVTTPPGFGHSALVRALLDEAGVSPPVSFESADLATIEGLVAAGLGVAIVPEAFAGLSGSVGLALASPSATRTIGLTWRTERPLAPPAARFVEFVRSRAWAD
jgi:LysR family transcriptional activator of glutamate synthase operon